MQCVANTLLLLTLEQVFGRIKNLSVYRSTFMLTRKFLHEHFVPPLEVASLSQQGRIAATQRAREVFSKHRACISTSSVLAKLQLVNDVFRNLFEEARYRFQIGVGGILV